MYPAQNDIALVKTTRDIGSKGKGRYSFRPICLPGKQFAFKSGVGIVGGWGTKTVRGDSSRKGLIQSHGQQCTTSGMTQSRGLCHNTLIQNISKGTLKFSLNKHGPSTCCICNAE